MLYLSDDCSPFSPTERANVLQATQGFLRSYAFLIQHKSDFKLARSGTIELLPKGIKFWEFVRFIEDFKVLEDSEVSLRYSFGQLRLSRLNSWAFFVLGRMHFHKTSWQYSAYSSSYFGPILFAFGFLSVALSAMQVAMSVQPVIGFEGLWINFAGTCRIFAVVTLIAISAVALVLILLLVSLRTWELVFATVDLARRR